MARILSLLAAIGVGLAGFAPSDAAGPLKLLFLGDSGHLRPAERFKQIEPGIVKIA